MDRLRPLHDRRRSGMTLLELMLVMMVMAIVMGMGIGVFASLDVGDRQAEDIVRGALRTARNAALARRAPAVVRVDGPGRALVPRGVQVVGTWHFEGGLEGAFGIDGALVRARFSEDGYLGRALELPGDAGDARAELRIETDPAFDFGEGFAVECALRPTAARSAHAVNVGNVVGVYLLSTGAVRAWFVPLVGVDGDGDGTARARGQVVLDSAPGLVGLDEWRRVRAEYDRRRLVLYVDGIPVAEKEETAAVAPIGGPLVLGGGRVAFAGRIDELVVGAWFELDRMVLPEGVTLEEPVPAEVAFAAGGRLDRRVHGGPVEVALGHADGRRTSVRIGAWGTVE